MRELPMQQRRNGGQQEPVEGMPQDTVHRNQGVAPGLVQSDPNRTNLLGVRSENLLSKRFPLITDTNVVLLDSRTDIIIWCERENNANRMRINITPIP
jgi:hypothetical protein